MWLSRKVSNSTYVFFLIFSFCVAMTFVCEKVKKLFTWCIFFFFAVLPQTVTISSPPEPFSVSKLAFLECRSSGSRPPATITWWKKGKFMGKANEEVSTTYHTLWKNHKMYPVDHFLMVKKVLGNKEVLVPNRYMKNVPILGCLRHVKG